MNYSEGNESHKPLIQHVSDASFEQEVLQSEGLKLVDFWAEWCGPCRAIAPHLESLAVELQGQVAIQKVDVDANPETAARYGVRSIPTLLIFRGDQLVERVVGAVPKETLKQHLATHLAQN